MLTPNLKPNKSMRMKVGPWRTGESGWGEQNMIPPVGINKYCYSHHFWESVLSGNEQRVENAHELKWSEVKSLSRVRLFATSWTVAYQAPPSMGFSRQECWSGLPFPSPVRILQFCLRHSKELWASVPWRHVQGFHSITYNSKKLEITPHQNEPISFGLVMNIHTTVKSDWIRPVCIMDTIVWSEKIQLEEDTHCVIQVMKPKDHVK